MQNPELTLMIYRSKQVKQTRLDPITYRRPTRLPVQRLRVIASNTLMAAGARIAPVSQPSEPLPSIGEVSIAGSTRNA